MYAYDGLDTVYINIGNSGKIIALNVVTGKIDGAFQLAGAHGTSVTGNRMEIIKTADGLKYLYIMQLSGTQLWRALIF